MRVFKGIFLYFLFAISLQTSFASDSADFFTPVDHVEDFANYRYFNMFAAGIRVHENPQQHALNEYFWEKREDYELGFSDTFTIRGMVISQQLYLDDERSDIAPMDMVIGWNKMSDPAILKNIVVKQSDRFYFWKVKDFPLPRQELELFSTNVHLIPNTSAILESLKTIQKGQVVELSGYLVDVKSSDGFIWSSSRVRNDTGDGACEIMLVQAVNFLQ